MAAAALWIGGLITIFLGEFAGIIYGACYVCINSGLQMAIIFGGLIVLAWSVIAWIMYGNHLGFF